MDVIAVIDPIVVSLMTAFLLFFTGVLTGIGYESWVRAEYIVEYRVWYPQNDMWSAWRVHAYTNYRKKCQAEWVIEDLERENIDANKQFRVKKKMS